MRRLLPQSTTKKRQKLDKPSPEKIGSTIDFIPKNKIKYSLERRWSIHSFRYGCLVTTSPLSLALPSSVSSTAFGYCQLPWCDGRCVQGPRTYSPWHSDPRLLAIPTSWGRISDLNPNWDRLWLGLAPSCDLATLCTGHCSTCVAQGVRAMLIWRHPHLPPRWAGQFSMEN